VKKEVKEMAKREVLDKLSTYIPQKKPGMQPRDNTDVVVMTHWKTKG